MSKSDARGFIILVVVLAAVALGCYFFLHRADKTATEIRPSDEEEAKELAAFQQLVREDSIAREENYADYSNAFYQQNARRAPKKYYDNRQRRVVETFPFNPNTCDSATFVRLGLPAWMASNAMKYRRKGGIWHSPDDFARLYGLSESDFNRLKPYIVIDEKHRKKTASSSSFTPTNRNASSHSASGSGEQSAPQEDAKAARRTYPRKYQEGEVIIDLNTCDTAELKRIPGIGSYYAGKICKYRDELGGYVSTQQLSEISDLPEGIEKWFSTAQHPNVRKINVNKASFKELVHHPYLTYEQVREITNYIRKYGPLQSW
ncbi:MAG: helix-hairpin-helix domain-containing protein, partial [Bacteroidaceae bacterium]|nr:helix-hairpin-helix domain-containing protein [Bacteroidaceae bacterium]